jgi:hypothetical protein
MSDFIIIKWIVNAYRFIFWLSRKFGLADFIALIVINVIALIGLVIGITITSQNLLEFLDITGLDYQNHLKWLSIISMLALSLTTLYILRLRKMGISSADAEIARGLDYKTALNRITDELDFVGIGAAKLTHNADEFTAALERIKTHKGTARLLLCDPRGPILDSLERISNVRTGDYLVTVQSSFALLRKLSERFGPTLQIRVYKPTTDKDLITLRLMFLNKSICLLSQNVLGKVQKEGRSTPQLLIDKANFFGSGPTLYTAFSELFDQMWNRANTAILTDSDFQQIADLSSIK